MNKFLLKLIITTISLNLLVKNVVADLNEGLVAYYPFDGNAQDASGNGNHATVYGATLMTDRLGNPNQAYYFDGIDDYIERAFDPDFTPNNQSWTVVAWVKSGKGDVISWYRCGSNPRCYTQDGAWYEMRVKEGLPQFVIRDDHTSGDQINREFELIGPHSLSNAWHFMVGVLDRVKNSLSLYVDGCEINQIDLPVGFGPLSHGNISIPFNLGRHFIKGWNINPSIKSSYYQGLIDDVRVYKRALTDSEIRELYSGNVTCHELLVNLDYFKASPAGQAIRLEWKTAEERQSSQFRVWRFVKMSEGKYIKPTLITEQLAKGESAVYSYEDEEVESGKTYTYRLSEIGMDGEEIFYLDNSVEAIVP
jgi:hypothetical protein